MLSHEDFHKLAQHLVAVILPVVEKLAKEHAERVAHDTAREAVDYDFDHRLREEIKELVNSKLAVSIEVKG